MPLLRPPFSRQLLTTFKGLSAEQRVLTEEVSKNPAAVNQVRRRASILLLLDDGTPLDHIISHVSIQPRFVRDLLQRYAEGGLYAALLGMRSSAQRRYWLGLSPMHHN